MSETKIGASSYGGRTVGGLGWVRWFVVTVLFLALLVAAGISKANNATSGDAATTGRAAIGSRVTGTVLFPLDSAALDATASSVVADAANRLRDERAQTVTVTGYTDVLGPDPRNDTLAQQRANTVAQRLRSILSSDVSIKVFSRGEDSPVAPNTNPDGTDNPANRQQNRRAVIEITKP